MSAIAKTSKKAGVSKYVFAGSGGQGVLFIGKVMAQAGMNAQKHVTWIPAYGPEMRGGTANCSVIVSDKKIGSPTVGQPDIVVAMNKVSYEKFLPKMQEGGTMYVNSSIVPELPGRGNVRIIRIPVSDIAHEMGKTNVANIVMLGAMQALSAVLPDEIVEQALTELGGKKPELAELNLRALNAGREYVKNIWA